jgi:linoleoyl-CoA desaturase
LSSIKFNGNQSAFYLDLKSRVNSYFEERKSKPHGDMRLFIKAALFMTVFAATYVVLVFFTPATLIAALLCIVLGIVTAAIGFNIMHDGGHGSFSGNKTVNRMAALTLNMLGCSAFMWNIKHNMLHHTYTNIEGHDDDIENEPFIRMGESQRLRKMHRFQHIYWIFIYGFMYLGWIFFLDFQKYFSRKIGAKHNISMSIPQHIGFWLTKVIYIGLFIVLPLILLEAIPFIIGYFVFAFTTGIIISVVFQLAHGVEGPAFIQPKEGNQVLENDWAVHQVITTANFATRSKVIAFFTGGLNHQIEHHLFPKISHVYYPQLSEIVKDTCREHGIRYVEQRTVLSAVMSHIRFLRKMGRRG